MRGKFHGCEEEIKQIWQGCQQDSRKRDAPEEPWDFEVWPGRERRQGYESKTGNRDWTFRGANKRSQGTPKESQLRQADSALSAILDVTLLFEQRLMFTCLFPWLNILIQPKEVVWIVVCLNRDHAVPAFPVGLGYAILFIATHEIYVDTRLHMPAAVYGRAREPRKHCRHRRTPPTSSPADS